MASGTKISAGSVSKGMWVRAAKRQGTNLTPAFVKVHEVHPVDIEEGKPGHKILLEDGTEYGHFPVTARFELGSEPVAKAPKTPKPPREPKAPKGPKVSVAIRAAMVAIADHDGSLTRADFGHVDPMVLKTLEIRGWATVLREGKERKTDLVEWTELGRKVAGELGLLGEPVSA